MRIIAGDWRGRPLAAPEGSETRPTADRVRETLFNMLASRLGGFEELRVADLYAGSGALGLEALSRGAAFACFVDRDPKAAGAIRRNAQSLGSGNRATILTCPVESLPWQEPFDLIFADPPYTPASGSDAVRAILESGWAAPGAWIAVESGRRDGVDPQGLAIEAERDVASARLTLFRA